MGKLRMFGYCLNSKEAKAKAKAVIDKYAGKTSVTVTTSVKGGSININVKNHKNGGK